MAEKNVWTYEHQTKKQKRRTKRHGYAWDPDISGRDLQRMRESQNPQKVGKLLFYDSGKNPSGGWPESKGEDFYQGERVKTPESLSESFRAKASKIEKRAQNRWKGYWDSKTDTYKERPPSGVRARLPSGELKPWYKKKYGGKERRNLSLSKTFRIWTNTMPSGSSLLTKKERSRVRGLRTAASLLQKRKNKSKQSGWKAP